MTMTPRWRPRFVHSAFVFSLAGLACAATARAGDSASPRVSMELRGCDTAFAGEVRRIAGIELHANVVDPQDSHGVVTETFVTCRDALADLWVSDAATAKVSLRTVSLAETSPRARARLIALAVAELVSTSWEEVETNPDPKVPAAVPPAPEVRAQVRRAVRSDSRVALDALADARFFSGGSSLLGGMVRSSIRFGPVLTLRLDVGAGAGTSARKIGDVAVQTTHGALGIGGAFDLGSVEMTPWGGVRIGYARLSGEPGTAATGLVEAGLFTGPEAGLDLQLWPRALFHLSLGIAGGGVLRGVRGVVEGEDAVGVSGAWGAVQVGLGISKQ